MNEWMNEWMNEGKFILRFFNHRVLKSAPLVVKCELIFPKILTENNLPEFGQLLMDLDDFCWHTIGSESYNQFGPKTEQLVHFYTLYGLKRFRAIFSLHSFVHYHLMCVWKLVHAPMHVHYPPTKLKTDSLCPLNQRWNNPSPLYILL